MIQIQGFDHFWAKKFSFWMHNTDVVHPSCGGTFYEKADNVWLIGDKKVITTQAGATKTWATIDSAAKWLKKLGLGSMKPDVGKWSPNQRGLVL